MTNEIQPGTDAPSIRVGITCTATISKEGPIMMAMLTPMMDAQPMTAWKRRGLQVNRKQTPAANDTIQPKKSADEMLGIKPNPENTSAIYIRSLIPKNLVIQT